MSKNIQEKTSDTSDKIVAEVKTKEVKITQNISDFVILLHYKTPALKHNEIQEFKLSNIDIDTIPKGINRFRFFKSGVIRECEQYIKNRCDITFVSVSYTIKNRKVFQLGYNDFNSINNIEFFSIGSANIGSNCSENAVGLIDANLGIRLEYDGYTTIKKIINS